MNKKGFTLIELLAVILILGIIALIAVPTVTKMIDTAKTNANLNSTRNVVNEAGKYYALSLLKDNTREKLNGKTNLLSELEIKNKPEKGEVFIDIEGKVAVALLYDEKCYVKGFDNSLQELDSDEKILKLFPDAEIKRVYFSNHNNSVVILLPQETIKKNAL